MPRILSKSKQLAYCGAELDVLKGVVNYADKMIALDGPNSPYKTLRRHPYGKTVVIDTEKKGQLVFRLSATSNTYPNFDSGYATPHSPVGRLCAYLRPGDEEESPAWGEYRVVETRLFDRFDGMDFEDNVRNFLRMVVEGEKGNAAVTDLLRTLRNGAARPKAPPAAAPQPEAQAEPAVVPEPAVQIAPPHPALQVAHLEVAEDEDEAGGLDAEIDATEDLAESEGPSAEEYYGLSEVFYVNRTREQDQVIARSPVGVMFVEGIAGSGKTSAALGRTKMLCDFNESSVTEEAAFREIAGQSHAHWSGKFAGKFSQEGSIGFVRTGELIQYLKETCRRIDLPNLPVAEFKELQVRLRQHRKVERSSIAGWRWTMLPDPRGSEIDTTMAWLQAADRAVSSVFAERMTGAVPEARALVELFVPEQRARISKVIEAALNSLRGALKPIQTVLRQGPAVSRFGLERLAENLARILRDLRSRILGKDVLWVIDGELSLYAANEHALAGLLVRSKLPLYLRNSARLVVLDEQGPVDTSLALFAQASEPLDWNDGTRELLVSGKLAVKGADGQIFRAVASDLKDISFKLLPEAIDRLYVMRDGKLHQLRLHRGLGRVRFELLKPQIEETEEDAELAEADLGTDQLTPAIDPKFKTLDALLRQRLQKALLQPLTYLADSYMDALGRMPEVFPDPAQARRIHAQMQGKKLADEDIDLLLCLANLIGRGFDGNPAQLRAHGYYQSVFIDEVQDFTEQQVYLMAEQAKPDYKAVTVVGDIAQKLHHGSRIDIQACFPGVSLSQVSLTENLRQLDAPGLSWFSACFRAELQDGLAGTKPTGELLKRLQDNAHNVRGPELIRHDDNDELDELVVNALRKVPAGQTAAVVLPDGKLAAEIHERMRPALASAFIDTELSEKVDLSRRHMRHFTSVLNAKGLEFDVVILPYLEAYNLEDRSHINRFYVGLTRARKRLILLADCAMDSARFNAVWSRYENAISQL